MITLITPIMYRISNQNTIYTSVKILINYIWHWEEGKKQALKAKERITSCNLEMARYSGHKWKLE